MTQSEELEQLTRELSYAIDAGDAQRLADMTTSSDDLVVIGTDEDEWLADADAARAVMPDEVGRGWRFVIDDVIAHEIGPNAGWAAARGRLEGLSAEPWPVRWTGVARREGGAWKFVHTHFSVPRGAAGDKPTG